LQGSTLKLLDKPRDLLEGEDWAIGADVRLAYITSSALTQAALHFTLECGHDLLIGKAKFL